MYSLSDATEYGRMGFGAKTRIRISNFDLSIFQQKDRLDNSNVEEIGTGLYYKIGESSLNPDYSVGVNFLNKKYFQTNNIYSFAAAINKFSFARLKVEYAKDDNAVSQSSYNINLIGNEKYFNYNVIFRHSSPSFSGSMQDLNYLQANFNIIPFKQLSIFTYYNEYRFNLEDNPVKSAPHNRNYGATLNYSLENLNIFGYARYSSFLWEDALSDIYTASKLNTYSFNIGWRYRGFTISTLAELYSYDKTIFTPDYHYEMFGLNLNYDLMSKLRITLGFDYYKYDNSGVFSNFKDRLQARMSADINITTTTKLRMFFYTLNLLKNQYQMFMNNSYYDLSLEQYVWFNHLFVLSGRYHDYGNSYVKDNYSVMLEYRIPLKIPTWKKAKPVVSISGRIYDAENPELGISGVTLYADGKTAVSDSRGNYKFEDMKPDIYYLELNRLTLDRGKTTVQKTPIEIKLKTGEEAKADIGVIRSAAITGKVMLYDFEERKTLDTTQQKIIESYGLPDFQIYVRNGRPDIYSATTDSRGKFDFHDLPPGHWVVKIIEGQYPDYHYLEADSVSFDLAAGERKDVLIRVLPRVRPIKIAVITDTIRTEEEIKPTVEVVPKVPLSVGVPRRFSYDDWSDSLDAITRSYLDDVAQYISDNRNFIVRIEGHTDPAGGIVVTQQTSVQKAQLVRDYLTRKGVPAGNILTQGFGSRRPIAPNTTAQGRARNRRVEITIQRR